MESMLWTRLTDGRLRCGLCAHACVLSPGQRGRCGVRSNHEGQPLSLVDGLVTGVQADPVEKKPLYHFLPGSRTFSVGSAGCNFFCRFCQTHHISRDPLEQERIRGHEATPEMLVEAALRTACRSLAFTYNEPTVFVELLAATAALGQERGLPSLLVSNGFMSPGCLELLGPLVRAANIDLKAFSEDFYHRYCGARLRPVLDNLVRMRALGWWLEVTTLILEGLNDGEAELRALARFIRDELGADTPWHVTAFHPAYRMTDHPATRAETLRRCRDIGLEEGLRFVYTGNVFCAGGGDTLCPQCGAPCLERQGWQVIMRTDTGVCPRCGSKLPGVWEL